MQRPTSVTVFAIINICLGALGLCGMCGGIFMMIILPNMDTSNNEILQAMTENNPAMQLIAENTPYRVFTYVSIVGNSIETILFIIAAIGLLFLKNWARITTIICAVYCVIMGIFGTILNFFVLQQPMLENAGVIIGMVFGFLFTVLILTYYIIMPIMLSRPKIVAAFGGKEDEFLPQNPDGSYRPPDEL